MTHRRFRLEYYPYFLNFKEPGGTSRGILTEKETFFIKLVDVDNPRCVGYGEAPVFRGLSVETPEMVEKRLKELKESFIFSELPSDEYSSVRMGIETAYYELINGDSGIVFPSRFTEEKESIIINGLIWMGDFCSMKKRIREKLNNDFRCIKVKVGGIKWDQEIEVLKFIRELAGKTVTIRLDANGAFHPSSCLDKLNELAEFDIHSIEQPIKAGNIREMKRICEYSPIPIALDEEIIGIHAGDARNRLLDEIRPDYIILKPALCYGFSGASDWINRAEERGIKWWITSALESSVGLNAIAQFTALYNPVIPQGLGTGNLFTNNVPSLESLVHDKLSFTSKTMEYEQFLNKLDWIN